MAYLLVKSQEGLDLVLNHQFHVKFGGIVGSKSLVGTLLQNQMNYETLIGKKIEICKGESIFLGCQIWATYEIINESDVGKGVQYLLNPSKVPGSTILDISAHNLILGLLSGKMRPSTEAENLPGEVS